MREYIQEIYKSIPYVLIAVIISRCVSFGSGQRNLDKEFWFPQVRTIQLDKTCKRSGTNNRAVPQWVSGLSWKDCRNCAPRRWKQCR
ncbi:hypothetical protein Naga_100213g4 [Nannochloropsis gaditana]|uniref:Uncharacterized protein n=1 Tax=Nannochloropsis gaditana TaxID=72520 RepID=W7TDY0_9STRA|nr:hypothetical protein Naga_100213g4 [Nannochloropsis gaditana]